MKDKTCLLNKKRNKNQLALKALDTGDLGSMLYSAHLGTGGGTVPMLEATRTQFRSSLDHGSVAWWGGL